MSVLEQNIEEVLIDAESTEVNDQKTKSDNEVVENKILSIIDIGKKLHPAIFSQIEIYGALEDVRYLFNKFSFSSMYNLLINGIDSDKEEELRKALLAIARTYSIPVSLFAQALIMRGHQYHNIDNADLVFGSDAIPHELGEFEVQLIQSNGFSRAKVEEWPLYYFLGSLIFKEA